MTLRELRKLLERSHLPPNTRVLVAGYEGGYKDIEPGFVHAQATIIDYREADYSGPHERFEDWHQDEDDPKPVELCLVIDRRTP